MHRPPLHLRLLALTLSLLVLAAACSGADTTADDTAAADATSADETSADETTDSEPTTDTATTEPATTEPTTEAATTEDLGTLTVGLICGGLTPMTAMMAINADTFPEGLEIEKLCFDGGSEAVQALIGGSLDVFMGSVEHVISTQTQGLPTRAYGVINNRVPYTLIAPPGGATSMEDLVGTQVGITSPGSLSDTELLIAAEQEGISYDDLTVIGAGSGATMTAALESDSVAAGMVSEPGLSELLQDGYEVVWEPEFDYVAIAVVANSDTVSERPADFEAFLAGLSTAAAEAEASTDWAVEAMQEEGFNVSDEVLNQAVESGIASIPPGLAVDEDVYAETIDLLVLAGRLEEGEAPSFEEAIDLSYLPTS